MKKPEYFQQRVLNWFDVHGRKHLPWQQNPTPYRVWISEIMLQQTQVNTVIPYYEAFMQRFPDMLTLAQAPQDDVLAHWSGLGYYARARNLHKTAMLSVAEFDGDLPTSIDQLMAMPGIGRSTAGAVLSLALKQPHPILDGNVKRVLARHAAVEGWPGQTQTLNTLWDLSIRVTPNQNTDKFNQAMMDLGATLCSRTKPQCHSCPVNEDCEGYNAGIPEQYPGKKPKKIIPVRSTVMLAVRNNAGDLMLVQRPPVGIWGGLWSLPEVDSEEGVSLWANEKGIKLTEPPEAIAEFRHTFSHFHLDIRVLEIVVTQKPRAIMEDQSVVWYKWDQLPGGIAAPVAKILDIVGETQ